MSHAGRIAAAKHVETLPAFDSLPGALAALFGFRDDRLALLARLAQAAGEFDPNDRPDSLKALERWYFDLAESDGFAHLGVGLEVFEECVAMYFFDIATRHAEVEWTVQEYRDRLCGSSRTA